MDVFIHLTMWQDVFFFLCIMAVGCFHIVLHYWLPDGRYYPTRLNISYPPVMSVIHKASGH